MFSMLDGEWNLNDVSQISFCKINFGMDAAQWTTACILLQAWTLITPTPDCTDVGTVIKRHQDLPIANRQKSHSIRTPEPFTTLGRTRFIGCGITCFTMLGISWMVPMEWNSFILRMRMCLGWSLPSHMEMRTVRMCESWRRSGRQVTFLPTYLAPEVHMNLGEKYGSDTQSTSRYVDYCEDLTNQRIPIL